MISADGSRRRRNRLLSLRSGVLTLSVWLMMAGWATAFGQPPVGGAVRELRTGPAIHDIDGLWSNDSKEKGPDLCLEVVFNTTLFRLLGASAYPNGGAGFNTRGDTSKIYGGFLLQWEPPSAFFFSTGIGLALHDGERETDSAGRKSLGSQMLFRIPIEIGYAIDRHHRLAIAFDHLSNAGLASPNEGMDTLGLVYGYRF